MWVIYILVAQIIIGVIVILFLRKMLEDMLLDMCVRQFEYWLSTEGKKLTVKNALFTSYQPLKLFYSERIHKVINKFWGADNKIAFRVDRSILGGMIIDVGSQKFDCSLRDRLSKAFPKK